jgi:hypothetical protein
MIQVLALIAFIFAAPAWVVLLIFLALSHQRERQW